MPASPGWARAARRPDGSYQVDGTPTDCVLLALGDLLPENPDFVFSGINHGPNMGEDVLYSGTVAAAMEGVTLGVPGVAISLAGSNPDLLESYAPLLAALVEQITAVEVFPQNTILNINLPDRPGDQVKGLKVTTLGSRYFSESLTQMQDPWGRDIYWIGAMDS